MILLRYWKLIAQIVFGLGMFFWGIHVGAGRVQAKFDAHMYQDGQRALAASEAARKHEQADAANSAKIAQAYEQGRVDAQAAGKRVADDLRAGNLKLRQRWQGCVSGTPASPGEPDADAADRAESAGRAIAAAREADEQIKGLQDLLRAERK